MFCRVPAAYFSHTDFGGNVLRRWSETWRREKETSVIREMGGKREREREREKERERERERERESRGPFDN